MIVYSEPSGGIIPLLLGRWCGAQTASADAKGGGTPHPARGSHSTGLPEYAVQSALSVLSFASLPIASDRLVTANRVLRSPHPQLSLASEANNGKGEFSQPQNWMRQGVFVAWGIQTGPFAAHSAHFVLECFHLFHFHTGELLLITPEG